VAETVYMPLAVVLTVAAFVAFVEPQAVPWITTCWFAFFVETCPLNATGLP
jgi:hypothetical protein